MRRALHYDAVVIGAGTAGLVAGVRLAQSGARVCVVGRGIGSTHLAPATVDVLGYGADGELVEDPGSAVEELIAARPDHPYARIGRQAVADALTWWRGVVADGPLPGYAYTGGLERNLRLPTAVGARRPSALVPETMAAGDGTEATCIVGTPALRDFHARLAAANLRTAGVDARAVELPLALERADMNTLGIARRFDDPAWRARFCGELSPQLRAEERLGFPAMLGVRDPHGVCADLEARLGRRVYEIPTLPPSVPGMRLFEVLTSALRRAGGRLVLGPTVALSARDERGVRAVSATAAGHPTVYGADAFVLATGGFASGGIELDGGWETHERVLGLPLAGVPAAGEPRFGADYGAEQPMARVGVEVDGELRAAGAENVYVVGAALPGAVPWREGSGEGIAVSSGYRVAELITAGAAARAGAAA